jgi:hypothetical protein
MNIRQIDLMILTQLYDGNHLEPTELKRARDIVAQLNINIKTRVWANEEVKQ